MNKKILHLFKADHMCVKWRSTAGGKVKFKNGSVRIIPAHLSNLGEGLGGFRIGGHL